MLTGCIAIAILAAVDAAPRDDADAATARAPRVVEARQRHGAAAKALFTAKGLPYPPPRLFLRAFKRDDVLELWAGDGKAPLTLVKSYRICARSGGLGPKRAQGDLQVPEGVYAISQLNPTSSYHLSLRVSYPNASDRLRATARDPGGDIFIHGNCVTIGCLPLEDGPIEELFLIVLDARAGSAAEIPVHLFPTRLDEAGMAWLAAHGEAATANLSFWRELQPIYQAFDGSHRVPRVRIDSKSGAYAVAQ